MNRPFLLVLLGTLSCAPSGALAAPAGEARPGLKAAAAAAAAHAGATDLSSGPSHPGSLHDQQGSLQHRQDSMQPLQPLQEPLQTIREAEHLRQHLDPGLLPRQGGSTLDPFGALGEGVPSQGGRPAPGGSDLGGLRRPDGGGEDPTASLQGPLGSETPSGQPRAGRLRSGLVPDTGSGSFGVSRGGWVMQDRGGTGAAPSGAPADPEPQPSAPQPEPQPSAPQPEPQPSAPEPPSPGATRSQGWMTQGWMMDGELIRTETESTSGNVTKTVVTDYLHGQPTHVRVTVEREIPRRIDDCGPDPCGGSGDPVEAMTGGGMGLINPAFQRKPAVIEALGNGFGRHVRPDAAAAGGPVPQLRMDPIDLLGQPSPDEPRARGGSGPAYSGYNPNDFVRPPRPDDR
jgi:hypothetical protein